MKKHFFKEGLRCEWCEERIAKDYYLALTCFDSGIVARPCCEDCAASDFHAVGFFEELYKERVLKMLELTEVK